MSTPGEDRDGERPEDRSAEQPVTPPERSGVDVEAAWADIVARWDAERPPVGAWPAQEDTDPAQDARATDPPRAPQAPEPLPEPPRWRSAGPAPGSAGALEDHEDRFVPPEPGPLRGSWSSWLPWLGAVGAPVLLLVTVVVGPRLSGTVVLLLVAAFVAGAVALVLRLPTSRDDDEDDGAVV